MTDWNFSTPSASNEWVGEYYIYHLVPTLKDLGASEPEIGKLILWFRKVAPEWTAATMKDFATYARSRLRIKLGQSKTNIRSFAMRIIDRLFNSDEDTVTLGQVLEAVALLVPPQPFTFGTQPNGDVMLVDLDGRILKCEKQFFEEVLSPLYPFEVHGTKNIKLVKRIPMGPDAEREVDLFDLACWHRFPSATKAQRKKCVVHSADELDWSPTNLYSRWEEGILYDRLKKRMDSTVDEGGTIPSMRTPDPSMLTVRSLLPSDGNVYVATNPSQVDLSEKGLENTIIGV
jgi:hypothetical protein